MFESLADLHERQAAKGLDECGTWPVEAGESGPSTAPNHRPTIYAVNPEPEYDFDESYWDMFAAILPLLIGLVVLLWLITK